MVTNPKQSLLFTAVPRGVVPSGSQWPVGSLLVGVRITINLTYDELTGATLGDFADFLDWPKGGLVWSGSFDGGVTWQEPTDVLWNSDQSFWSAAFHADLPVVSKPVKGSTTQRSVDGYPMRKLASELPTFHTRDSFVASPLGGELLKYVYPDLVNVGAAAVAPALTKPSCPPCRSS